VVEERAKALRLSKKAIEVGNDDAIVLATIGQTLCSMAGELDEGAALLGRAIALDPNLAPARYWSGSNQLYLGNIEVATGQYEIALRLSPLDSRIFLAQAGLATANFLAGRYEEGLSWARAAIHRQPNFLLAQRTAMACYAKLEQLDEARRICAHVMEIDSTQRISDIGDRTPFRRSEDIEKLAEAFRIAGMPE
jgi:adenylate cyclase